MHVVKYLGLAALAAMVMAASTPAPAVAQTPKPQAAVSDDTLTDRIENAIENDATLAKRNVDVDVDHGVVTLTGTVRSEAERMTAERLAKIDGVIRVDNQLKVDPNAPERVADRAAEATKKGTNKAIDATKKAANKTVDKTKEIAGKTAAASKGGAGAAKDAGKDVGQKTKEAASTTGEAVTDGWITTKIKAKMIDEDVLKGSDVSVDTNDHVVTLKGTVKSDAGKARAEEIARTTDGVKRVVNSLVVKP
jgi:osmotically-inducible protein OsmY